MELVLNLPRDVALTLNDACRMSGMSLDTAVRQACLKMRRGQSAFPLNVDVGDQALADLKEQADALGLSVDALAIALVAKLVFEAVGKRAAAQEADGIRRSSNPALAKCQELLGDVS